MVKWINTMVLFCCRAVWLAGRAILNALPLPARTRERLQQRIPARFGRILNMLMGYDRRYLAGSRQEIRKMLKREASGATSHYVPLRENRSFREIPVKVLAFYLPQFHAIPENDAWWGKGFTEWTNVTSAKPQFSGHYQPRVPGELGYYDLLDPSVQLRQADLARNYGLGGFCFHFYWFSGKTLLEKPLINYLASPQPDFPFCISWANENWTRRWDGMENEILIRQQHSPEDDLAFIRHVSKYLADSRYIRINGRPLLLVYRPELLPSAAETADRWRNWCRANGVGDIYLANVQSFVKTDPADIGYDAAVEFPPNPFNPMYVTHLVRPFSQDFSCSVYDWKSVKMRGDHYSDPGFRLFRGVCPAWDNTPRRKNKSLIYVNNQPEDFRQWVFNAAADTCGRFVNPEERLIFVNAWNEWAEAAYLEPDQKYGYAFLQAIYDALADLACLGEKEQGFTRKL